MVRPITVLKTQTLLQENRQITQVLVSWEGLSQEDASWMDLHELMLTYPDLDLEDTI